MTSCVIDASYILSLLMPDEANDQSIYKKMSSGEMSLAAPVLFGFEVCNAILLASRRKRFSCLKASSLIKRFLSLPIVYREIDLMESYLLADKLDLTVYDASYVWLARKLKVELLTGDKKMREAVLRS